MFAADTTAPCVVCGTPTTGRDFGRSMSVEQRDGTRRLAAPYALCHTCHTRIVRRQIWAPAWCASCEAWRPADHSRLASAHAPVA